MPIIFHMCDKDEFNAQNNTYIPPTYDKDGFIHFTEIPSMLLTVANHFYKESKGDWICLEVMIYFLSR
jgi:uncharacterized protein (DUF952 family)